MQGQVPNGLYLDFMLAKRDAIGWSNSLEAAERGSLPVYVLHRKVSKGKAGRLWLRRGATQALIPAANMGIRSCKHCGHYGQYGRGGVHIRKTFARKTGKSRITQYDDL